MPAREDLPLSKTIYVGNLAVLVTEGDLRSLFQPHGGVHSVYLATDIDTGRARGYAMVEMIDDGGASTAIRALDGTELGGQALRVSARHDRQDGSGGRGYGR